jgi:hypothetical protein
MDLVISWTENISQRSADPCPGLNLEDDKVSLPELLNTWITQARAHGLVKATESADPCNDNMMVFSAASANKAGIKLNEMCQFLIELSGEYGRKAKASGVSGWFYAWYDDPSITLRCSFIESDTVEALPFGCTIDLVTEPERIASAALKGGTSEEIGFSELRETKWTDDVDTEESFVLTVYAHKEPN